MKVIDCEYNANSEPISVTCEDDGRLYDFELVRHASWVLGEVEPGYFTPGGNRPWICSHCKEVKSWCLARPNDKYCQNCGAKMDGGNNNE